MPAWALLERLQFLHAYHLTFVQRIELRRRAAARYATICQMQGCFSIFERQRWESDGTCAKAAWCC